MICVAFVIQCVAFIGRPPGTELRTESWLFVLHLSFLLPLYWTTSRYGTPKRILIICIAFVIPFVTSVDGLPGRNSEQNLDCLCCICHSFCHFIGRPPGTVLRTEDWLFVLHLTCLLPLHWAASRDGTPNSCVCHSVCHLIGRPPGNLDYVIFLATSLDDLPERSSE